MDCPAFSFVLSSGLFQASDDSFLDKIHQQHAKHKYYVKPKVKNGKFGVKHYAGAVLYHVRITFPTSCREKKEKQKVICVLIF